MRKNIVVGNWKMNLKKFDAINLVNDVLSLYLSSEVEVVFAHLTFICQSEWTFWTISQFVLLSGY